MKSGFWQRIDLVDRGPQSAKTSGLAGLLKPMWLSLICTKVKSPPLPAPSHRAWRMRATREGHRSSSSPGRCGPCHNFRNPRRSTPSFLRSYNFSSIRSCIVSGISPPWFVGSQVDNWPELFLFPGKSKNNQADFCTSLIGDLPLGSRIQLCDRAPSMTHDRDEVEARVGKPGQG